MEGDDTETSYVFGTEVELKFHLTIRKQGNVVPCNENFTNISNFSRACNIENSVHKNYITELVNYLWIFFKMHNHGYCIFISS